MSTDIHWIIERRDTLGRWHTTASKTHFSTFARATRMDWIERNKTIEERLGNRNYQRFNYLSNVGSSPAAPLTQSGMPGDAAPGTRQEYDADLGGHNWGHALGTDVLEWRRSSIETVAAFARDVVEFLGTGRADTVLAECAYVPDDGFHYTDIDGIESAHARAERLRHSAMLVDWRTDPTAWRIVLFYDS